MTIKRMKLERIQLTILVVVPSVLVSLAWGLAPQPWAGPSVQVFCSLMVFGAVRGMNGGGAAAKNMRLYAWNLLLLGPFAILILVAGIAARFGTQEEAAEDFHAQILGDSLSSLAKGQLDLTPNLWRGGEAEEMEPFVDIMKGEDRALKQSVIDKVLQHPGKLTVQVLRQGVMDSDADIRYFAASGLIQLNDSFQVRIQQFREQVRLHPKDPDGWFGLAATYDQYVYWELSPGDLVEVNLDEAETCYRNCLELDTSRGEASWLLGRILIQREKLNDAQEVLEAGFKRHPDEVRMVSWLAEALYLNRRYEALEELAHDCTIRLEMPEALEEVLSYWAFDSQITNFYDQLNTAG